MSLLTLKPGLFTAYGRDAAGDVWLDDLAAIDTHPEINASTPAPDAWLFGLSTEQIHQTRNHATHKGSHGETLIIGGQGSSPTADGMTGAAVLAARAALRSGAGRVYVCLLESSGSINNWDPLQPELMFRQLPQALEGSLIDRSCIACGCGGGGAIAPFLPQLLSRAPNLVLDADALNAIAESTEMQGMLLERASSSHWNTIITPHPLEAARLLNTTATSVNADRVAAAQLLSERFGVVTVLKGSGTIMHSPGQAPLINASGNRALATAGTGDVLAGMIAASLAQQRAGDSALDCTARAVFHHGWLADQWRKSHGKQTMTADQLTQQ